MPRRLPPLNALKAFEAAARHESFTRAAEELCVTQGAVSHHVDFAREDIDLAIRHGDGTAGGLHVTRLCTEELFPVCSPKLLNGRGALRTPADLGRFTLLHVSDRQGWRQ